MIVTFPDPTIDNFDARGNAIHLLHDNLEAAPGGIDHEAGEQQHQQQPQLPIQPNENEPANDVPPPN